MVSYEFNTIAMDHQNVFVLMSPLLGATLGFFMTLAKTPHMILMDCIYGAFLGLLATLAYTLIKMSLEARQQQQRAIQKEEEQQEQEQEQEEQQQQEQQETEEEKADLQRIMAQLNELGQDRQRLLKARLAKKLNGPISMRTRSQTSH